MQSAGRYRPVGDERFEGRYTGPDESRIGERSEVVRAGAGEGGDPGAS